jgi:hypothetical protein
MNSIALFRSALLLLTAFCAAHLGLAQDLAALRDRMEQRLPAITALKNRQVAGETNRGFLEVRGAAQGNDQQVVSEENSDRRQVYAALAAKTGASVDEVGRQRAAQIAVVAKRGHWIQEPNGNWKQK